MIILIRFLLSPILVFFVPVYFLIFNIIKLTKQRRQKRYYGLKIICIGNITLGGTGKTEIVKKIIQDLKNLKKSVAILTRGYKRKSKIPLFVSQQDNCSYDYVDKMGDEAFMLFNELKVHVFVNEKRKEALNYLLEKKLADIVICDDGLQDFSFYKDISVLVLNTMDFTKFQCLLPLGNLREPFCFALKRVNFLILNHSKFVPDDLLESIKKKAKNINSRIKIITTNYIIKNFVNILTNKKFAPYEFLLLYKKINLSCGIADPSVLIRMLEIEGFDIEKKFFYPDHYWYKIKNIKNIFKKSSFPLVITRKDAVRILKYLDKIEKFYLEKIFYIDIVLEITEGKDLWKELINSV
ncbi:MAG: tetraacyldisaccharide 4'-kinase [Elusimicrobiota bacterium]|nr:tetraacyldisaccharide 4'-kinase [Endomicrobiia bacterium]MDW8165029.1 tetraacyldisaccharide 4'-kinase [Elusimicrobiota bacterium]